MANFDAPKKTEGGSNVPNMPSLCMRSECDEEADIVFIVIRDEKGRPKTTCAADVGYRNKAGYQLKDCFTFVRWVSRCSKCHYTDLLAAQKVYFKNKWCERVIQKEVKDMSLTPEQTKNYLNTLGNKIL